MFVYFSDIIGTTGFLVITICVSSLLIILFYCNNVGIFSNLLFNMEILFVKVHCKKILLGSLQVDVYAISSVYIILMVLYRLTACMKTIYTSVDWILFILKMN